MIETKEHAAIPWVGAGTDTLQADSEAARAALVAEWRAAAPETPEEIAHFYATSQAMIADLDAWHALPARQLVTEMLVHVATQADAKVIVDIGCGGGHDLIALQDALPHAILAGVEPNRDLRPSAVIMLRQKVSVYPSVHGLPGLLVPIEQADLLICIDVLEHIPDPETFLAGIAQRAPVGCLLFEATASFDTGTPLHLPANRGWHPGRVLETHGWEMVDRGGADDRVRVWRRDAETGRERAHLLLCAYRNVTTESLQSIMGLTAGTQQQWRLKVKAGDSLIARSRSIVVTHWWRSTADDVFLMVDDDITFSPDGADNMAELCRSGFDIVCGAYPVRNGAHFACRTAPGTRDIRFGPSEPPLEIVYAATGFMAVHRKVIDALVATLPLCHPSQPWSFYPLFQPLLVQHPQSEEWEWVSEDWGFSEIARRAGFKVWLDPRIILAHAGTVPISVGNMSAMHAAIEQA